MCGVVVLWCGSRLGVRRRMDLVGGIGVLLLYLFALLGRSRLLVEAGGDRCCYLAPSFLGVWFWCGGMASSFE